MITGDKFNQIVYQYWANRFGCKRKDFHHHGTLVIMEDTFDETDRIIIYHIDKMSVARIAPTLANKTNLPVGYSKDFGALTGKQLQQSISKDYQLEVEGPFLDCYLYPEDFKPFAVSSNYIARRLHPKNDDPILLSFYADFTEEDLDEAEILVDEPDPVIYGLFRNEQMVAYASHRYWDDIIADIGVLVHPNYRSQGLGKAVVSELCQWCIENDVVPMYRVFRDHVHSWRIQQALGFTEMVNIETLILRD